MTDNVIKKSERTFAPGWAFAPSSSNDFLDFSFAFGSPKNGKFLVFMSDFVTEGVKKS